MTLAQAYNHGYSDEMYGFTYVPDETPEHIQAYARGRKQAAIDKRKESEDAQEVES